MKAYEDDELKNATCTIYFPELFQKLRSQLGDHSAIQEEQFIQSLMHNNNAALTGGKVGEFFITHDSRFIIKVIQRDEKRQFCDMCLEYFQYCQERSCCGSTEGPVDGAQLSLVQILGLYRSACLVCLPADLVIVEFDAGSSDQALCCPNT